MKILGLKLLGLLLFIGSMAQAQETIRGEVKDRKTGEGVYGAIIRIDGVGKAKTDFDGAFSAETTAGKHIITVSNTSDGYIDEEVEVEVIAGVVLNVAIEIGKDKSVQKFEDIKVVVVKSVGTPTTLAGSDKRRMEENAASDEMPKEQIKNSGVNNAADAVQMVPAASVQDGKNVFIRGLGDRYTKTILNGMDIPGLDPDRNSVQMDIFPAVMIDNITVYKTFTPNLTADFTGGLINIATKDFPGRKTIYVKGGFGYNTNATFNPDFISYDGGKLDFLGFDDGTRALPISPTTTIPHPSQYDDATEIATRKFGQTMATHKAFSFMNQNHAVAIGDQINMKSRRDSLKKITYGYNAVLNYRTSNNYYADVEYNEFLRDTDHSETKLFRDRTSRGEMSTQDVMWTALVGNSIKWGSNKISLVLFQTQNGTKTSAVLNEVNYDSNQATLVKQGLQYTQRSISNANLSGLHYLDSARNWKLNWSLSPTYSKISDPDIRSTALEVQEDANGNPIYLWEESVGAEVRRIFRSLNEYNVSGKADFDYTFNQWDSLESTLSFGVRNTYKHRNFDVSEYVFRLYGTSNVVPNDPDWFFQTENIWTPETGQGTYATGQQEKANIYEAAQNTAAAYVMNELPLSKALNVTYGARVEQNINWYTGQSNNAETDPTAPRYDNEVVLNTLNVLPSVNTIYKIRKDVDTLTKTNSPEDISEFKAKYDEKMTSYNNDLSALETQRDEELNKLGSSDKDAVESIEEKYLKKQQKLESKKNAYILKTEYSHRLDSVYYSLRSERSTNFRGAYTQTVARPSFREISISQIYDPIQGRRYLGNIDLKQTLIHNADLRWEYFFGRTELISASAFYKKFINPIEIVANVAAPNEFKPVNAGQADVYGAEIEVRKAIGFAYTPHISLVVGANFTYVVSQIDMTQVQTIIGSDTLTEYDVRLANARDGETISKYRPMYGQSPYIINAFVTFKNDSLNLMFNLNYNVQGKKLAVIGVGSLPDVYEQPFHNLNMKISKGFGQVHRGEDEPRWQASLRATNLLQIFDKDKTFTAKQQKYEAYNATSQYFQYLNPGMTFSASVTYTIR